MWTAILGDTCAAGMCRRAVHQLPSQADFSVFSIVVGALAGAGGIEPPNGGIKVSLIIQRFQGAFGRKAKNGL
jgi:hypothetical protein